MALPETTSKEGQNSKSNDHEDKDFDPSAEALINDIDDERTLEEEEALGTNSGAAVQEELNDLKRESEMPIEELIAYYQSMRNGQAGGDSGEEDEAEDEEEEEEDEDDDDEEEMERDDEAKDDEKNDDKNSRDKVKDPSSTNNDTQQDHSSPGKSEDSSRQKSQSARPSQSPSHKRQKQQSTSNNTEAEISSSNIDQRPEANNDTQKMSASASTTTPSQSTTEAQQSNAPPENHQEASSEDPPSDNSRHPMTEFVLDEDNADGMFRSFLGYDFDEDSDMDDDYDWTDEEEDDDDDGHSWRRVIHVGPEYQAEVPEGLAEYSDLPPYEAEDTLVWTCNNEINYESLMDYLKKGSQISKRDDLSISPASVPRISNDSMRTYREKMQEITSNAGTQVSEQQNVVNNVIIENPLIISPDVYMSQSRKRVKIDYELEQENAAEGFNNASITNEQVLSSGEENSDSTSQEPKPELSTSDYFQDEEQLLYLLVQCNYIFDEALRRRKIDPFKYYLHEPMTLWSPEECLGFEHGLRSYGKDFRLIRENKVPTRTRAEVVAFYYLWKKSERHDVYTNQYKLDRKRSMSHPGTTDYMDKFIEDNESALNSSSPSTSTPTDSTTGVISNISDGIAANAIPLGHECGRFEMEAANDGALQLGLDI